MARSSDLGPLPLNWRDVGVSIATLSRPALVDNEHSKHADEDNARDFEPQPVLPSGRLLRSGQLHPQHRSDLLGNPATVINLRRSDDFTSSYNHELVSDDSISFLHIPADNTLEVYDTADRECAKWIATVLKAMANASTPILIHCRSGRDRTGVVVAAALLVLGVSLDFVRQDFAVSSGAESRYIDMALAGLLGKKGIMDRRLPWLRGVDVFLFREKFLGECIIQKDSNINQKEAEVPDHKSIAGTMEIIGRTTGSEKLRQELAYLRRLFQNIWKETIPAFEDIQFSSQEGNKKKFEHVLNVMLDITSQQLHLLHSLRALQSQSVTEFKDCSGPTRENRCAASKKIAFIWAKRAWIYKITGEYQMAAEAFSTALKEATTATGSIDDQMKIWDRERSLCSSHLA